MQQQYRLSQLQHDKVIIYSAHRASLRLVGKNEYDSELSYNAAIWDHCITKNNHNSPTDDEAISFIVAFLDIVFINNLHKTNSRIGNVSNLEHMKDNEFIKEEPHFNSIAGWRDKGTTSGF